MFFAILALIEEGDEVIYPDPGFPIYESMTRFVGGDAGRRSRSARRTTSGSTPTSSRSLVTPRTKLIIFNSPHNPTGGVLTRRRPRARSPSIAREHDLMVLADEIYGRIIYDGEHVSIADAARAWPERTIVLDGFSKTYAMTGWRHGLRDPAASRWSTPFSQLIINSVSCTSALRSRSPRSRR